MGDPSEKRKYKRLPAKLVTSLRKCIAEKENSVEDVTTGNICQGGVFLETNSALVEGDIVEFEVRLPEMSQAVPVVGIVRWRQQSEPQGVGVELARTATGSRDQFNKYIEEFL